jgi:hypothetical protein
MDRTCTRCTISHLLRGRQDQRKRDSSIRNSSARANVRGRGTSWHARIGRLAAHDRGLAVLGPLLCNALENIDSPVLAITNPSTPHVPPIRCRAGVQRLPGDRGGGDQDVRDPLIAAGPRLTRFVLFDAGMPPTCTVIPQCERMATPEALGACASARSFVPPGKRQVYLFPHARQNLPKRRTPSGGSGGGSLLRMAGRRTIGHPGACPAA